MYVATFIGLSCWLWWVVRSMTWELTFPFPKALLKMIFVFPRWNMWSFPTGYQVISRWILYLPIVRSQNVVKQRFDFRLFIWWFLRIRYQVNHHWGKCLVIFSNHQPFANPTWQGETPKRPAGPTKFARITGAQEKAVSFCLPLRAPVLVNVLKGLKQTSPSCYHRLAMECTLLTKWMSR